MKTLILILVALNTTAALADGCGYVEARRNFEVGQHGPLLASYLNYTPREADVSGIIDRSDDQFGVCRIMANGTVITSYGCAGEDSIKHHKVGRGAIKHLFALLAEGKGVKAPGFAAYKENLYERNQGELMTASTLDRAAGVESTQKSVKSHSELAAYIRQLCPLDSLD